MPTPWTHIRITSCWVRAPEVLLTASKELHDRDIVDDNKMSHQPTRCFSYSQPAAASRTTETRHRSCQLVHSTLLFQLSS